MPYFYGQIRIVGVYDLVLSEEVVFTDNLNSIKSGLDLCIKQNISSKLHSLNDKNLTGVWTPLEDRRA